MAKRLRKLLRKVFGGGRLSRPLEPTLGPMASTGNEPQDHDSTALVGVIIHGCSPDTAQCGGVYPDCGFPGGRARSFLHSESPTACIPEDASPPIGTSPDARPAEVFTHPALKSRSSTESSPDTAESLDALVEPSLVTPQLIERPPQTEASNVFSQPTLYPTAPFIETPGTSQHTECVPRSYSHRNPALPVVQLESSTSTPGACPFGVEHGSSNVLRDAASTSLAMSSVSSATANPPPADAAPDHKCIDGFADSPLGSSNPQPYSRAAMRPDDVCAHCWEGIFAWGFGFRNISGNRYSVSHDELLTCRSLNCMWYRCLEQDVFDEMLGWFEGRENDRLRVLVEGRITEVDKMLDVAIDDGRPFKISLQADNPVTAWIEYWTGVVRVKILDALAWAEACTEECAREHKACQKFRDWSLPAASLPTRLIDCSDPRHPRVVDTDSWDRHVEYVALSYVWGEEQPNRTTITNLAAYHENIDVELLPHTIVDAIEVAHALGMRYLWIDSLCIVQDSREDKHRELAKMRDVYCRALLTIDAAGAYSASEGFLPDDGWATLLAFDWLPFAWSRRHNRNPRHLMDLFERTPGLLAINEEILQYTVTGGFTARRAWCLQESLMSGCLLHFKFDLLQFSCRTSLQRFIDSHSRFLIGKSMIPDVVFQSNPSESIALSSEDQRAIHLAWIKIVQDYAHRSLSQPEDKLVACAGVAELFRRALGPDTEYLAGLWRDSLLFDLLWFTIDDQAWPECCGDPLAPSWSWAAYGGPVHDTYFGEETVLEELAEVVECAVTPEDPALPFGRVTGGHLILRTPLLGPFSVEDLRFQGENYIFMDYHDVGQDEELMDTSVWIVPLLHAFYDPRGLTCVRCLLVRLCTGQPAVPPASSSSECPYAVYQRAGYCEFAIWRGVGGEIIAPLVDSLENKVYVRLDFPRTVIKLV